MATYSPQSSVQVKCNWVSNISGKNIKDTVKTSILTDENDSVEENITDVLDILNTVNFIKPNETDIPFISLKTEDAGMCIEKIVFYCDVKTVEIFGNNETYQKTEHGKLIQSSDDFNIYEYKVSLKSTSKDVMLKLVRLSNPNYFWVYAFLVKLKKVPVEKIGSINYENVENMLKDLNISEAAKNCFNFMKSANSENLQMQRLNEIFKSTAKSDEPGTSISQTTFNELKTYIDYKFSILTEFLILREKHLNDKLDQIMDCVKQRNK